MEKEVAFLVISISQDINIESEKIRDGGKMSITIITGMKKTKIGNFVVLGTLKNSSEMAEITDDMYEFVS